MIGPWRPLLSPAEDLAALDRLFDTDGPHGILHRDDLTVRTERTVWAARQQGRSAHPAVRPDRAT
ncbi:hypothetical protein [Streptosporangium sp. H16]|uniref:hypothetical protein n=1 Tax=Streptosporangium sp. H16 TaxID=3444184 RepID=UPI003F7A0B54